MLFAILVNEGQPLWEWRAGYGGAVADESLQIFAVKGVFLSKCRQLSQARLVVELVVELGDEVLKQVAGNGIPDSLALLVGIQRLHLLCQRCLPWHGRANELVGSREQ